jgi:hypothetical protein
MGISTLFLIVGAVGPKFFYYPQMKDSNFIFTPSFGRSLASALAEIHNRSFGAVAALLIGQVLSQRSMTTGITLRNLSLRNWITDPGSIIADHSFTELKKEFSGLANKLAFFAALASLTSFCFSPATSGLSQ